MRVPSYVNTAFYPTIVQYRGWAIQDTYGCPILDTNGQMIFRQHTGPDCPEFLPLRALATNSTSISISMRAHYDEKIF